MNVTTAAAQVIIAVIPIVGIVMGSVIIFFYLLWNHRQKTLLIKAGQFKKGDFNFSSFSLLTGLLLIAVGIALSVLLIIIEGVSYALLGGIIPFSVGLSLAAHYIIKRSEKSVNG